MASSSMQRAESFMVDHLPDTLRQNRFQIRKCFARFVSQGKRILQPQDILNEVAIAIGDADERKKLQDGAFGLMLLATQEAVIVPPYIGMALRPMPGVWEHIRFNTDDLSLNPLTVPEYLQLKECIVDEGWAKDDYALELDFEPFNASFPRMTRPSSIGNGVHFLNRHLSSRLFRDGESMQPLLDFLQVHNYKGEKLMINERINSLSKLHSDLCKAEEMLSYLQKDTLYEEFGCKALDWRKDGEIMQHMFWMEILQAPDPITLQKFLGKIPTVFSVVIFSPHGYFGQADVLGLPDTGGQIVYILDQVKALEEEILLRIKQQGLEITPQIIVVTRLIPESQGTKCNQKIEKILDTQHSQILRVPFRTEKGILRHWVSRFDVWPYLEKFAEPALYEAFGLTVIEAMTCGLPTFATSKGGPAEIIIDGVSGFHVDPYNGDEASEKIADFFERCKRETNYWNVVSDAGLQRIYESYTWKIYAEKLINLAGIYGFWKYVSKSGRRETQRYMEMFYILKYRNLVKSVPLAKEEELEILEQKNGLKLAKEDHQTIGRIGGQSRIKRILSTYFYTCGTTT